MCIKYNFIKKICVSLHVIDNKLIILIVKLLDYNSSLKW